jgi:hypothetical protein
MEHMGGVSDIAPILSYHQALISASQEKAKLGAQGLLRDIEMDRTKGTRILEEEKKVFDSITVSNTLIDYQNNILDLEQNSLAQDQYAQGHLERVTLGNRDLVQNYMAQFNGDAEIQDALRSHFMQAYSKIASRAFEKEHIGTVAKANDELQEKANDIAILIAKGADPEQALRTMDPIIETIPDYLPEKTRMVNDARNSLVLFSAMTTARKNPELAALNMSEEDSIYSLLTPAQRLHVNEAIKSSIREREHNNAILEQAIAENNATTEGTKMWNIFGRIDSGKYGLSDFIKDSPSMNKYEQRMTLDRIHAYMKVSSEEAQKDRFIAQGYQLYGNYSFLDEKDQKRLFTKKVLSGAWLDEETGTPIVDENGRPYPEFEGRILQTMAKELKKYNFTATEFQQLLYKSAMSNNPTQIKDALLAYQDIFQTHRSVLGQIDSPMNQQIIAMSSASELSKNAIQLQEIAKGMQVVKSEDEVKTLSDQFEGKGALNLSLWVPGNIQGGELDSIEDASVLALARKITKDWFIKTGNLPLAYQVANKIIGASYDASSVNGPQVNVHMVNPPECYIDSSHNIDPQMFRKAFNNEAVSLNANSKVILDPSTEWGYNKCTVRRDKIGKLNGIYWYMSIPGKPGKYHIHYDYQLGSYGPFAAIPIAGSGPEIELNLPYNFFKGGKILSDQNGIPIVIDIDSALRNYIPDAVKAEAHEESTPQNIMGELVR